MLMCCIRVVSFGQKANDLIPVSGHLLESEAPFLAKELGNDSLKASNSWLQSFQQRYNIVPLVVRGEVAGTGGRWNNVHQDTFEGWIEQLSNFCPRVCSRQYTE